MKVRIFFLIFLHLFAPNFAQIYLNCSSNSMKLMNYTLDSLNATYPNRIEISWRISYTQQSCWSFVKFSLFKAKQPLRIIAETVQNTTEGMDRKTCL